MGHARLDGLVRRAAGLAAAADLPDPELLRAFAGHGDQAAFEALVRRHGPIVLGVCRRVRDRYDSSPAYFDPRSDHRPPAGGNAKLICEAFGRPDRRERVEPLLRADLLEEELPGVPGEQERHAALTAELGMPAFVAGVCYSSIAGGYVPKEFIPPEFEGVTFEAV